jgi:hypothetical protein
VPSASDAAGRLCPCFSRPVTAPEAAELLERRAALLHDLVVHRRLDLREVLQEDHPWAVLPNVALGFIKQR